jgi:hypothetical protein
MYLCHHHRRRRPPSSLFWRGGGLAEDLTRDQQLHGNSYNDKLIRKYYPVRHNKNPQQ